MQCLQLVSPANNPEAVSVIKRQVLQKIHFLYVRAWELNFASSHLPREHGAQGAQPSQVDWVSEKVPERLLSAWAVFTVYFH